MHEMSLCESLLRIMEEQAQVQHFHKVKTVWLAIGALANVEVEAMRFGFAVVMKDTLADGAILEIIHVPAQAWCDPCQRSVTISQRFEACAYCGSQPLQITGGEELKIKELEVE